MDLQQGQSAGSFMCPLELLKCSKGCHFGAVKPAGIRKFIVLNVNLRIFVRFLNLSPYQSTLKSILPVADPDPAAVVELLFLNH